MDCTAEAGGRQGVERNSPLMEAKTKPGSDAFWDAFSIAGQTVVECDFCKRTIVAMKGVEESDDYWSGEDADGNKQSLTSEACKFERLAQEKPDRVILNWEDSSIASMELGGRVAPYGCPCGIVDKHEQFILAHRDEITRYLVAVARAEYLEAAARERATAELGSLMCAWIAASEREDRAVAATVKMLDGKGIANAEPRQA